MGGGKSGAVKGKGGGGVAIGAIENAGLKEALQNISFRTARGQSYTFNMSQKDGKAIEKNTGVGDALIYTNREGRPIEYVKTGANEWSNRSRSGIVDKSASDGMARIMAGMSFLGGSWTYRKKAR